MEDIDLSEEPSCRTRFQEKPQETAINVLKDAFPGIEEKILNAVLIASQGAIGPAFDALLSITDSNYKQEPLRSISFENHDIRNNMERYQVENDFRYAYNLQQMSLQPNDRDIEPSYYNVKKDTSFINDKLPIIHENLKQSFNDAKTKVSSFFSNIKKRIDKDTYNEINDFSHNSVSNFGKSQEILIDKYNSDSFSFDDIEYLKLEDNKEIPDDAELNLSFEDNPDEFILLLFFNILNYL